MKEAPCIRQKEIICHDASSAPINCQKMKEERKMMNIKIIAVGKLKEKYWKEAEAEYKKRLGAYCNINVIETKEDAREQKEEEAEGILSKIKEGEFVITLEINGKNFSSEDLAEKIENLGLEGKSNVTFVIGGSCGLDKKVLERSNMALSFSKMTFPHQMMRVILLEQVYRTFKIIKGEKYHK